MALPDLRPRGERARRSEATFAQLIRPGEKVWLEAGSPVTVVDVVETLEEPGKYGGLLKVD